MTCELELRMSGWTEEEKQEVRAKAERLASMEKIEEGIEIE